ncbi:MAG: hypothetical protein HZA48_02315 [Planctomycetes bacterium]|nr:hypothetical protein [Planctomycetota bacterium]
MPTPFYIIAATPQKPLQFENFFDSGKCPVVELVKNPPSLRRMGWDLVTLDTPRILKGECWEVNNAERKRIRLYKDGTVIFRAAADDSFLGLGRENHIQPYPSLNALALVEVTYNFVKFYSSIIMKGNKTHVNSLPITFQIKLINLTPNISRIFSVYLNSSEAVWDIHHKTNIAPETQMQKELTLPIPPISPPVEEIAYKIIEIVFTWFGIPANDIPYTITNVAEEKCIDINKITRTH